MATTEEAESSSRPSSQLWYNSRSQIEDGRSTCERFRYLSYHSGPNGYGIVRRAQSLPLATGTMYHTALAGVLEWCRDHDPEILDMLNLPEAETGASVLLVPRETVRASIEETYKAYDQLVEARGFAYMADSPEVQYLLREQKALIAGLTWAWTIESLPEILRFSKVIEVERDEAMVYACTCELGAFIGTDQDHVIRGCQGKALMVKPDFLTERRDTGELGYHEFKGTGMDAPSWRDKWEVMIQMITATTDAERRHGKPVVEIWVHGLIKGKREQDYNPETGKRDAGNTKQQSIACYGYLKPAKPPMEGAEIRPSYEYWDEYEQKTKRLGKGWKRTPIWDLQIPIPDGWDLSEAWMEFIGSEGRRKILARVGPLVRQEQMVEGFFEEARGEEDRWIAGVWELHDIAGKLLQEDYWKDVWSSPEFQSALNRLFPRSYACRRYGMRHACQFEDLCFQREGWTHPLGASEWEPTSPGVFILRRPHHQAELQQAIDRGLLPPEDGMAEEPEE